MNTQNLEKRHLVISHLENDRPFRIVGSANKKESESHYTLFLRILPGIPFHVVPHRDRLGEYLVFSGKKKKADGSPTFFCKVGSAIQLFDKNVIEIHLPDLRQVYYLKLDPNIQSLSESLKAA
ncbi:hypothetical protein [Bdellovibrio sp.]|uniref:hypothetical protein n=1 Tax=Bdellovibrio sp. TaxID=28201 RepID=UPI001A3C04FF|nr:MAG: hypothetical protein BroJett040_24970 [Oligoflexia bacterium]